VRVGQLNFLRLDARQNLVNEVILFIGGQVAVVDSGQI
jgi:hypothetical protein